MTNQQWAWVLYFTYRLEYPELPARLAWIHARYDAEYFRGMP